MSELSNRSTALLPKTDRTPLTTFRLYNSRVPSDVILKQIFNGQAREYHAHNAVLCMESRCFVRAFTGNFKKTTENVIELHDDDPDHFEFLPKSIYHDEYDIEAVEKLAGTEAANKEKRILVPIGIYAVADK
ncbi:hypothetical protein N0V91_002612 [Didymella pomorum]|uniref:BTB domain-containing protein n=1 Tax=Didymella pomorum TaxID=749634 RepID=A0A9W9DAX1_9PLEO|nr:hypothetical protein N0V91_002612 [Didymella pomorum]